MHVLYYQMRLLKKLSRLLPNDEWQMVDKNAMRLSDLLLSEKDQIWLKHL